MKEMRFTNKQLIQLIIPLVIEQILAVMVGLADSIMVASVGEAAVSSVSLVDNVMILLINVFAALATGGAVVVGHYVGQNRKERANKATDQLVLFSFVLALVVTAGAYLFHNWILHSVFGKIDEEVMINSRNYLLIVSASIPFLALYNSGAAVFRVVGNSKISMETSLLMNIVNVIGNAIMIYGMKLGVIGAAIPTLLSRILAAVIMIVLLRRQDQIVHLSKKFEWRFDRHMVRKILHIGIPNGLENSMFQLGKILVLSLVSTFGTASIAANAVAGTITTFQVLPGAAMGFAVLTVVSQCVGAGEYDQAKYYTKKLIGIVYLAMIVSNLAVIFMSPLIMRAYNLSDITAEMATNILTYHGICAIFIWPLAFTLPNTLRAANDVKYTMYVSIFSMWVFRIIFSYILGRNLKMGVFGIWVAMTIDWLFRAICFAVRYFKGKWMNQEI